MAEEPGLEYQKFIAKRGGMLGSIYSSCKKRLEQNSKLTTEELFTRLSGEFNDLHYEDKRNWLIHLKKIKGKILQELQESKEIVESETIGIEQETTKTSLSHLPGDTRIEKGLPYHDRDEYEPGENMRVVIPPREEKSSGEVQLDLDLELKPISKKKEEEIDKKFPFGKMR